MYTLVAYGKQRAVNIINVFKCGIVCNVDKKLERECVLAVNQHKIYIQ